MTTIVLNPLEALSVTHQVAHKALLRAEANLDNQNEIIERLELQLQQAKAALPELIGELEDARREEEHANHEYGELHRAMYPELHP